MSANEVAIKELKALRPTVLLKASASAEAYFRFWLASSFPTWLYARSVRVFSFLPRFLIPSKLAFLTRFLSRYLISRRGNPRVRFAHPPLSLSSFHHFCHVFLSAFVWPFFSHFSAIPQAIHSASSFIILNICARILIRCLFAYNEVVMKVPVLAALL